MNTKISLSELTDLLSRKSDSTKKEAEQFLKEFFSLLSDTLAEGESLKINGLGQFRPIWVDSRTSVNVHTGEPMEIPGHYKLSFTPDKSMREAVNAPFSAFVPEVLPDDAVLDMPEESDADDEPEDEMPLQPAPKNKPADVPAPAKQSAAGPSVTKLSEKELETLSDLVIEKLKAAGQQKQKPEEKTKSATAETPVVTARVDVSEPDETPVEEPEAPKEETPAATPTLAVKNDDDDDEYGYAEILWEKIRRRPVLSTLCAILAALLLLTCSAAWQLQRQGISMRDVWTYYFPSEPSADDESQPTLPLSENNSGESLVSTPETTSPADDVDVSKLPPVAAERMGKGSRLTLLALKYYGHKDFWVYIYEENKTRISNPNRIPVGFDLSIPDARKYGIDANDELSLQKAQDLARRLKEKYE